MRKAPINPPVTGGDGYLDNRPPQSSFSSPWAGFEQKSRSQVPTLPNKLEADYTGTQPGDGPRRAGCTCGPPDPPSQRRGRAAALDSPPSPPGAGRRRLGGVSGEVKGLTFWAPGQQGQTPNTHLQKESAEPYPGILALQLGGGRREGSARKGEPERGRPASPPAGPTARGPSARHSNCPKRNNLPGPRGQRWEPSPATLAFRYPLPSPAHCEFGPWRRTSAPRWRVPAPARLPPAQRSAPARERCAPTWGAAGAAWPPSHGLC